VVVEDINFEKVSELTSDVLTDEAALYVEVLEESYHNADIIGFSITNENGQYYIPVEVALSSELFKKWAEDETKQKIVYDGKKTSVALNWKGISLKGIDFDVLIAAYLLNPSQDFDDVASVARTNGLSIVQADELVYGKGAKRAIPDEEKLSDHIVRKGQAIFTLKEKLVDQLEKNDQSSLFYDLELPLSVILAEMEATGVKVDVDRLKDMGKNLAEQLKSLEVKIFEHAGEAFNINSPKQLGVILFEKLGLPVIKKTKTGFSTSADVLEKLEEKHEIVREILHYRQLGKLQSTYIEGLLKVVHEDTHKIHTRFNQVLTTTGRLSSIDPNLQNIPIRLEEGRKIRQAFVPSKKDWVMFAADYSQIELRVLAHIANDKNLVEAFRNDLDIHTKTAMDVFHVAKEDVTSNMRRQAKAVNFGIVYGISDYGLSQNLGITRKEAGEFIKRYLETFVGVQEYMDDIVADAREKGYVKTLLHRRRYIPEITSRNFNLRSFAERTAMNTPIQGSAADIIKKAMIDMADRLKQENVQAKLLLQVHDELIFEAPKEEISILEKIVPEVMENAVELNVPLKVDYSYGASWYDAK
jgi:DNA polymerase-1